jgi:hypothetical protein
MKKTFIVLAVATLVLAFSLPGLLQERLKAK